MKLPSRCITVIILAAAPLAATSRAFPAKPVRSDLAKWAKVVRETGAKVD